MLLKQSGVLIRTRLIQLGKKQKELMPELEKRGLPVYETDLSAIISGKVDQPKATAVRGAIYEILDKWEKERDKK